MSWVSSLALILFCDVVALTYIATMCPKALLDNRVRYTLFGKIVFLLIVIMWHSLGLILLYGWVCFIVLVIAGYYEISGVIKDMRDRHDRDSNERE